MYKQYPDIPDPTPEHRPIVLSSAKQIGAVVSAVRDQIYQVIVYSTGPGEDPQGVSIVEIAQQLGRPAASLYRHIDLLLEVGLIHPTGTSSTGGRTAQMYAADGNVIYIKVDPNDTEAIEVLCKLVERNASWGGKQVARATRKWGEAIRIDPSRDPTLKDHGMNSVFGWLDPDQQKALHDRLYEITKIFDHAHRRPGTKLISAEMFIHPVELPDGSTPSVPAED